MRKNCFNQIADKYNSCIEMEGIWSISKQDLLGVASRNGFGHPTFYYQKVLLFRKRSLIICIQDKKKKKLWGKLNIEITGTYAI